MTNETYKKALELLGWKHLDAGCFFHVNHRTSQKWASGERRVPRSVEVALYMALKHGIDTVPHQITVDHLLRAKVEPLRARSSKSDQAASL